jgi:hypothetical protein
MGRGSERAPRPSMNDRNRWSRRGVALIEGGMSQRQAAKALGVHHSTIQADLADNPPENGGKRATKAARRAQRELDPAQVMKDKIVGAERGVAPPRERPPECPLIGHSSTDFPRGSPHGLRYRGIELGCIKKRVLLRTAKPGSETPGFARVVCTDIKRVF